MSKAWEVMDWAWTVPVDSAAERSVLTAYGWRAGTKLIAWPGLDQLVADTCLYRETISTARANLVKHGYLEDTGQRRGYSGRVSVYRLNLNQRQKPPIKPVDKRDQSAAKAADSNPQISGFSSTDKRQKPLSDKRQKPLQNCEVNYPMNSSGAQAREPAHAAKAENPEQPQDNTPRVEESEAAAEKCFRLFEEIKAKELAKHGGTST